jgi:hypothetical protein
MVKELMPPEKWLPVSVAPFDADLEVSVIDNQGVHALVFPCRRTAGSWIDAITERPVDVVPTHWRRWREPF